MKASKKGLLQDRLSPGYEVVRKTPDEGLLLVDMALHPVASDRGAAAILNGKAGKHLDRESAIFLPPEIVDWIAKRSPDELSSAKLAVRVGNSDYVCRAYLMQADAGSTAMLAVHMERVSSTTDPVKAVAAKYHLTEREEEALRGVAMGLSSKELAEQMAISPNTVKVFLRLIMIKMRVTTRGGIVAQILQNQSAGEEQGD